MTLSVQPEWMKALTLQQQSVLFLASRGPDGIAKDHPCKDIQRCYRATVFLAARYGRQIRGVIDGEGDSFMSFEKFDAGWMETVKAFLHTIDELPHHYIAHLAHGAQILGYKHPAAIFRSRWLFLYEQIVADMHLTPETEEEMDERLSDWGHEDW